MADLWRVTYMGEGVKSTTKGAFAKYTTAFTDEEFAKSVAGDGDWIVADPSGRELGSKPARAEPKPEKKAEEKPAEKAEKEDKKKAEKADDKKAEKADDKKAEKAEDKKAEKAEKK